ncbi:hypothetical protein OG429_39635 [Streptomyces sp. NBC_00190]|nr:hypothetical protein [Streptomyces sp. NBC_00190]WSZ37611.1 hypothetical protein OG239_01185 [Streptomyces sp. NBC_00868]
MGSGPRKELVSDGMTSSSPLAPARADAMAATDHDGPTPTDMSSPCSART